MMPYLIIFLFIAALTFLDVLHLEKQVREKFVYIVFGCFLYLAGLKYETGVDWLAYTYVYDDTMPINKIFTSEGRKNILSVLDIGYSLLNSVIKYLGGSIQTIFFIMSFSTTFFLTKGLQKYTPYVLTGLLIYFSLIFFVLDMSGIRQALALTVILNAVIYIEQKKTWKYFGSIMLAGLFHWSAFLFVPFYFFANKRFPTKYLNLFFTVFVTIYLFDLKWMESIFLTLFPQLQNELLAGKLLIYTTNTAFSAERQMNTTTIVNIGVNIIIYLVLILNRKSLENKYPYFNVFLNFFMLQMFAYFALFEFIEIAERMRLYFLMANLVLLPYLYGLTRYTVKKTAIAACIIVYGFLFAHSYLLESATTIAYHPYQNYIIYKLFDKQSTAQERLRKHASIHNE